MAVDILIYRFREIHLPFLRLFNLDGNRAWHVVANRGEESDEIVSEDAETRECILTEKVLSVAHP